jgi:hypothetical protein
MAEPGVMVGLILLIAFLAALPTALQVVLVHFLVLLPFQEERKSFL